jgi:hypothetical protein
VRPGLVTCGPEPSARSVLDSALHCALTMALRARLMKQAGHILAGIMVLGSLAAIVGACGEGNGSAACLPEDVERCTCADGKSGFTVCDPKAGAFYGACNCALDASPYLPEAGVEASSDAAPAEAGACSGPVLAFMCSCSTEPGSPQCPSGDTCYPYPSKGSHCSHPCKEATDCAAPSPGCSPMDECKAP